MSKEVVRENIGIDISKDDFKVCFYQRYSDGSKRIKGSRSFANNLSGFKSFVSWMENKKKRSNGILVGVTMEATGVYHEQLAYYLNDKTNYRISIELPNKTKAYMRSLNIKTKTDKIDAKALGLMGLERELKEWKPASKQLRELKQLTRGRVVLIEQQTAIKNRLHALSYSYQPSKKVRGILERQAKLIVKQIVAINESIEELISLDSVLKEQVERVSKIKGLGIITIAVLLAETDGLRLFTSKGQLISYAGYDVVQEQSGSSINKKGRISKKGNRYIRRALFLPSMTMSKYEPMFKVLYNRVCERTKIKKKGLVAVQRKALVIFYTLIKKGVAYDPNYGQEKSRQDTMPAYTG